LLYTHEGLGGEFFPVKPEKKLEEYKKQLTKFNAWVDAIVERRGDFYFVKNTRLVCLC
jgi:hypothetical protein